MNECWMNGFIIIPLFPHKLVFVGFAHPLIPPIDPSINASNTCGPRYQYVWTVLTCGQYVRVDSVQYVRTPRYDSMLVLIRVVQYVRTYA